MTTIQVNRNGIKTVDTVSPVTDSGWYITECNRAVCVDITTGHATRIASISEVADHVMLR